MADRHAAISANAAKAASPTSPSSRRARRSAAEPRSRRAGGRRCRRGNRAELQHQRAARPASPAAQLTPTHSIELTHGAFTATDLHVLVPLALSRALCVERKSRLTKSSSVQLTTAHAHCAPKVPSTDSAKSWASCTRAVTCASRAGASRTAKGSYTTLRKPRQVTSQKAWASKVDAQALTTWRGRTRANAACRIGGSSTARRHPATAFCSTARK